MATVSRSSRHAGRNPNDAEEVKAILPKKRSVSLPGCCRKATEDIRYGEVRNICSSSRRPLLIRDDRRQFPAYRGASFRRNDKRNRIRARSADQRRSARRIVFERADRGREISDRQRQGRRGPRAARTWAKRKKTLPVDYDGASMQICFNAQ